MLSTETTNSTANPALRKRITGKALIIFIAMLVLLTFFSSTLNNLMLPRVTVESPTRGDIVKDIGGDGIVEANEVLEKYIASNAIVTDVEVKVGDLVKKGQTILNLDTGDLEENLMDEKARYEQKKLQLEKLQDSTPSGEFSSYQQNVKTAADKVTQTQEALETVKALYGSGAASKQDLDTAQTNFDNAGREYETAKFNLDQASKQSRREIESLKLDMEILQRNINKLTEELNEAGSVTAPFDGIIEDIGFTKGTMANSSRPIYTLVDASKGFHLEIVMDTDMAKYLTAGETVNVTIDSLDKMGIEGKISEITDNEQQKGDKKDVSVSLDIPGLTGGEPGSFDIKKKIANNGFLVSNDAIHTDSSGDYILVVKERDGALGKESYVQETRVTTGESDNSKTAVDGGMMMDNIVVKSSKTVESGDRVIVEK